MNLVKSLLCPDDVLKSKCSPYVAFVMLYPRVGMSAVGLVCSLVGGWFERK